MSICSSLDAFPLVRLVSAVEPQPGNSLSARFCEAQVLQTSSKILLSPGADATEEGKLYALCGLRVTDRAAFERYATELVGTDAKVTTQFGCLRVSGQMADMVKRIASGVYDSDFTKN